MNGLASQLLMVIIGPLVEDVPLAVDTVTAPTTDPTPTLTAMSSASRYS